MRGVRAHTSALRARSGAPDVVVETIHRNAASLVRLARRHSLCADDANDAHQRGREIFLRKSDTVEPETALAWLRTVVNRTFGLYQAGRGDHVLGIAEPAEPHGFAVSRGPDVALFSFTPVASTAYRPTS